MTDNGAHTYPLRSKVAGRELEFRLMTMKDRDAIVALARSLPEHDLLFLARDITQVENVEGWINDPNIDTLVAVDGDEVVGYAAIHRNQMAWSSHVAELRVMVAESMRGKGLGRVLTQEAFAWMLATRFFERADPERGRFRGLLKTALARFAVERLRRENADKRGGGRVHERLDVEHERADPGARTPDQALDDAWRAELLAQALERLEQELTASGRRAYFEVFRDYFLTEDDAPDYASLAQRHGISTTDVSNWLGYAKRRYRECLRALVRETVGREDELREELAWLFGPEARGTKRP